MRGVAAVEIIYTMARVCLEFNLPNASKIRLIMKPNDHLRKAFSAIADREAIHPDTFLFESEGMVLMSDRSPIEYGWPIYPSYQSWDTINPVQIDVSY